MAIKDKPHRAKSHQHENIPPHQEKYQHGSDDWNIATTALPIDNVKVASHPGDSGVVENQNRRNAFPMSDSEDSRFIHQSTTNGKGR